MDLDSHAIHNVYMLSFHILHKRNNCDEMENVVKNFRSGIRSRAVYVRA